MNIDYIRSEYIRSGDDYIPSLRFLDEDRPTGKWGRMHREYLRSFLRRVFHQGAE